LLREFFWFFFSEKTLEMVKGKENEKRQRKGTTTRLFKSALF
jgi:hypothetical protein